MLGTLYSDEESDKNALKMRVEAAELKSALYLRSVPLNEQKLALQITDKLALITCAGHCTSHAGLGYNS